MRLQVLPSEFTPNNKQAKSRLIVAWLITPNPLKRKGALEQPSNITRDYAPLPVNTSPQKDAGSVASQRSASPHNQRYVKWLHGLSCPLRCAVPYSLVFLECPPTHKVSQSALQPAQKSRAVFRPPFVCLYPLKD